MDDNSNYPAIKSLYKLLIFLTFAGPSLALVIAFKSYILGFFVMAVFSITPHIMIFYKYYKSNDESSYQQNIKKILKTFLIAAIIFVISFLPMLTMDNTDNGIQWLSILAVAGFVIGLLGSWTYYTYSIINNFNIIKKKEDNA
jgi:protein-S-isoprenylcysteine O-methyltransferase Ste14